MNEQEFEDLVDRHRRELFAHCYRMLGSTQDAEDALQEAMLAAWRGIDRFEGRSSLRSWLYTIATNTCLRAIERRPKRVLPIDYGPPSDPHDAVAAPLVESVWIDPLPGPGDAYEEREGVELAFVAALQHLPANQRAVLVLREVLGFSAKEAAEMLDTTSISVDSALQRARKTVDAKLPERSQQETLAALEDTELKALVDSFVDAWERTDVDAVVALLTDDAVFAMPPHPTWYSGRDAVAAFFAKGPLSGRYRERLVPTRANGQIAVAHYWWDEEGQAFTRHGISVLTLRGAAIAEMTIWRGEEAFAGFDLPETVSSG
jgi:RNA polymerase sigma-70 factor (ECF subfamily)